MQESERGKFEAEWKKAFDHAELTPSDSVWQGIGLRVGQGNQKLSGFETGWRKAFVGAELNPSEEVWKAIDVSLVQAENVSMKMRVVFYQRLAAASVIMLMLMGGYFLFRGNETGNEMILSSTKGNQNTEETSPIANHDAERTESPTKNDDSQMVDNSNPSTNQPKSAIDSKDGSAPTKSGNDQLASNNNSDVIKNSSHSIVTTPTNQAHYQSRLVLLKENENTVTPLFASTNDNGRISHPFKKGAFISDSPISEVHLLAMDKLPNFFGPNDYAIAYRLADARPAVRTSKRKPVQSENKWASVAFSAGTFSPSVGGGELTQASSRAAQSPSYGYANLTADQPVVREEKVSTGTSMAFAVAAGKRIFKKWLLQGGVSYLNQTSTSNTDAVAVAPANQLELADSKMSLDYRPETTNSVTYTTPSEINSSFQFISIPVQAGYMVVDRKFGVQINGGVSPDFFLKSSVYDESTQTDATSSATGTNESFKVVSLAGIGGIELSYKFSRHYRVSLAPGFRYALTPVYKENSLATAKPFVADIGLRFRYVFN